MSVAIVLSDDEGEEVVSCSFVGSDGRGKSEASRRGRAHWTYYDDGNVLTLGKPYTTVLGLKDVKEGSCISNLHSNRGGRLREREGRVL